MIATDAPLGRTLDSLAELIEAQIGDVACAILLSDAEGRHLRLGGAGRLSAAYRHAIDGIIIGDQSGACGAACQHRKAVTVTDIAGDPRYMTLHALAKTEGLKSCTSTPIISAQGDVLGTLAVYRLRDDHRLARERTVIDMAIHIATIAIRAARSQQNLQQQLHFMQQLVDTIPCPIFFKDEAGRYLGGNRDFEKMLGLPREKFIGKTVYDIAPKDLADRYRAADDALFASLGTQIYEAKLESVEGTIRNVVFHKATFSKANGELGGLVGVVMDITDAKITEAKWMAAARDAEIANRAKSNFLAQMSHELRTPLNAIIGFSEAMKLEFFGPLTNPFYQSYAGDIYQSGHLLLSLINDILDLSKIEAGKYQLHLETLDLRDVIHGALHMVEKDAREAGLSLTLQMTEAPASLLADRRAVIRIILNLLSNAIKFTPTGGSVELHCATGESGATIVVTDSGIGMAPGEIPIALTAFGQLDNAYARDHRGTGLGLPMVKSLAEQHGGRLEIESQPGKGTTVTVWLPGRADLVQQM